MFEGLDNRHIGILHIGVLAYEGYCDIIKQTFLSGE